MQLLMQKHCAVFRDGPLLAEGAARMDGIVDVMRGDLRLADRSMVFNTDLVEAVELDNMLAQSVVSLRSAIARTESRGSHARGDYPRRDDRDWLKHTYCWRDDGGRARVGHRPVHLRPLSEDVDPIPPRERVY
jgi:succinate dehydrogenase / fumarate reductase flavoprotein subunit